MAFYNFCWRPGKMRVIRRWPRRWRADGGRRLIQPRRCSGAFCCAVGWTAMQSESTDLLHELADIGQRCRQSQLLVVSFWERQDSDLQIKLERLCYCYINGDEAEREFIRQQAATQS